MDGLVDRNPPPGSLIWEWILGARPTRGVQVRRRAIVSTQAHPQASFKLNNSLLTCVLRDSLCHVLLPLRTYTLYRADFNR